MDGAATHALIGSQARVADSLKTYVGPVVTVWMVGTLMSHGGTASVATTSAEATLPFDFRGSQDGRGLYGCSTSASASAAAVSTTALRFGWLRLLRPVFGFGGGGFCGRSSSSAAAASAAGLRLRRRRLRFPRPHLRTTIAAAVSTSTVLTASMTSAASPSPSAPLIPSPRPTLPFLLFFPRSSRSAGPSPATCRPVEIPAHPVPSSLLAPSLLPPEADPRPARIPA